MIGEIIAIGDELTSGRIHNSTSYFAASHLYGAGHEIAAMATIGDSPDMIGKAIRESIDSADFVVVTCGLWATSDDMTTEAVADALDRPTIFYPEIFEKIRESQSFKEMPSLEKLAWLPSGAQILKPGEKIAGYLLVYNKKPIFFLPGIPYQMRELMLDRVIPRLAAWGGDIGLVRQKVYKVFGLEEHVIHARLTSLEKENRLLRIGYYPVASEVHVSLTVRGETLQETDESFLQSEVFIKKALGDCIYDEDGKTLEMIVGESLLDRGFMLGAAESCTGGLLAHRITSVSGSSAYFSGAIVAYTNEMKQHFLGVRSETLEKYGAVSRETAREMAFGACREIGSDIAVAITGIAGPAGGTKEKPVGTVCFGLATPESVQDFSFQFSGKRAMVQIKSAMTGLDLLRLYLQNLELPSC